MSRDLRTKDFINHDSPKKIERQGANAKQGSREDGTDAAHKLSWGLANVIDTHTAGRPKGEEARHEHASEMNSADNLRIKTEAGNRKRDEYRDGRIAKAFVTGSAIEEQTTAARAWQAYQGAQTLSNPKYAEHLGDMRVRDPETGRTHMLRNHDKHV